MGEGTLEYGVDYAFGFPIRPNDFVALAQWGWAQWTAIKESGDLFL